ncbi:S8 family serine peptidase [Kibdelosporangium philippinense]|uniref:S8 family serine peptidase n=1 Tax=Kibdelosporangium philippinense TaxID=211113 RepID=A0ABS8ZEJ1_9PSEU|nr:S8 family serine peptidase [Kibdelosporangium philippinense]MCE7006211.1 S8 family serine peptidase [Kibdelosporangium philippinense]
MKGLAVTSRSPLRRCAGLAVLAFSTAALGLAVPAAALAAQPPAPEQPVPGNEKTLDSRDRALVAEAVKAGKQSVTVLVAAEKGRADAAANELRSIGANVKSVEKDVDYLKVTLPPDKARQAAKLDAVRAIDVDGLIARDEPGTEGMADPIPQPAPGANTPRANPYMPTGDTKAAQFGQLFPFWDGKDVLVAILDSGVDLDHPALAKTSSGDRKIVDWYNANAPDSGDSTWVAMSQETFTGTFTAAGRSWTAPATGGPYTIGVFNENAGVNDFANAASEIGGDVNRDGDKADRFGVLQDVATKEVRVDLNGNGNFTDDTAMIDYKVKQDVGHFGTDNPATAGVRETVPFVVQTDKSIYGTADQPFVGLGIAAGAHGSHVAGITAGNALLDGKMAGAAPGAKLMAVKACLSTPSCTDSGLTDGVLYAARNGADVVNISIGGLPALNDGNSARAQIYNRIIAQFNIQLFISAGNSGSGANTVGDPSVASDAVSVGSSVTKETWLANYGSQTAKKEGLHPYSSRGPREDGGFKPNIVAPGSAISSIPLWQPASPVPGTYTLPNGYAHFNGTSMAAPQATGAAALLVSAYKATHGGKRPNMAALRNAIYSSARFLDGVGAYEQGNGLFDVFGAFFHLASNPNPDTVTSAVEVNTVLEGFLPKPGIGVGIHDREGVVQGKQYNRTYTFTRTSGSDRTIPYRLKWIGNDGTFSSPDKVNLPLNKPVSFNVKVNPRNAGVHSAVLELDNPFTSGTDTQLLNTVFVAQQFDAGNKFTVSHSGKIDRNQTKNFFVNVPQGTTGLKLDLVGGGSAPGAGQVRFVRVDPRGIPVDVTSTTNCYNPDAGAGCSTGSPTTRTVNNPLPGVWEFYVEARRTSDTASAPFSITATAITTKINPNPDTVESMQAGVPLPRNYSVANSTAAFNGRLVGGPLSSALQQRPNIAHLAQQQRAITVLPGSTSLSVAIGKTSDPVADLDLFLFNCTTGTCVLAAQSADADSEESVRVVNPAAGLWVSLVDGFAVPAGTTDFDYQDVFSSPQLGTLAINDANAQRGVGATWSTAATVTAAAVPPAGRKLRGDLTVQTSDGGIVGNGTIQINAVTP